MPCRSAYLALIVSCALALSCTPRGGASPAYGQGAFADPYGEYGGSGVATGDPTATPPPGSTRSPGCGKPPAKTGATVRHVKVLGRARAYTLVVPAGYSPETPYPLVFVLHGGGGSATAARTQTDLEKLAGGRAVFAYPSAVRGTWNLDAPTGKNGDVALFDAILLAAHNDLCIDGRRVFVTGFSNGAYMANQLACKRGDRIRGVVTHAGGGPYEASGTYDATGHLMCPGKAVASLVVHGARDGTVAPAEGQKSLEHWSYANRCTTATANAYLSPCVAVQGCFQPVGICRIPGLGHGLWPSAGKITWSFFESLR